MNRSRLFLLTLACFLVLPQTACANAGTPLMWAGMLHLVIGNALIGALEATLLRWWFGARVFFGMVLANYLSAWTAGMLLAGFWESLPVDLNNGWMWFGVMVLWAYALTLVIEWPFVAFGFRDTKDWFRRSVRGSLAVQSLSYLLMIGWYCLSMHTSLFTTTRVVAPAQMSLPDSVLVYFISSDDGHAYKRPLFGGVAEPVCDLGSTNTDDRLLVRPNAAQPNHWDLVARLRIADDRYPRLVEVRTNLQVEAAADWRVAERDNPRYKGSWSNFGPAPRLGAAAKSSWEFRCGFWAAEGLRAHNQATGQRAKLAYETPFGNWSIRNAVHLPTDQVLFQLGKHQICVFDPATKQVALLFHGRGPVAVIEPPGPSPTPSDQPVPAVQAGTNNR